MGMGILLACVFVYQVCLASFKEICKSIMSRVASPLTNDKTFLLKLKIFDYIVEPQPSKFLMFHKSTLSFIFNKYMC